MPLGLNMGVSISESFNILVLNYEMRRGSKNDKIYYSWQDK